MEQQNNNKVVAWVVIIIIAGALLWWASVEMKNAPQNSNTAIDNSSTSDMNTNTPDNSITNNTPGTDNNMQTTNPQVQVTVETPGTGTAVTKAGDTISVNYTGTLTDGTVFDSNIDPKFQHVTPFSFQLGGGQVIPGWDQGLIGLKVGEKVKLMIPSALAYGAQAVGTIPANSDLIFEVTILSIK